MYEVVPVDSSIIVFSGDTSSTLAPRFTEENPMCASSVHLCTPYKKCKAASYYDAVTERTTKFYHGRKKKSVINKIRENNILLLYSKSKRFWISYRNIRKYLMLKSVFFRRYFLLHKFRHTMVWKQIIIIIVRQRCRVSIQQKPSRHDHCCRVYTKRPIWLYIVIYSPFWLKKKKNYWSISKRVR